MKRILQFLLILTLLVAPKAEGVSHLWTSSSFNLCATGSNDNRAGTTAWLSTGNITALDGVFATCALAGGDTLSQYCKGVNYFTAADVPAGATINGLEFRITRKCLNANSCQDNSIVSIKGGTPGGTNKSAAAVWPTTNTAATYGTTADLWGQTWTQSDVIAATFGFEIQVDPPAAASTADIDGFEARCTYTPAASGSSGGSITTMGVGFLDRMPRSTPWKHAAHIETRKAA